MCRVVLCVWWSCLWKSSRLAAILSWSRSLSSSETLGLSVGQSPGGFPVWKTCCLVQGDGTPITLVVSCNACGRDFACHPRGSERNLLPLFTL